MVIGLLFVALIFFKFIVKIGLIIAVGIVGLIVGYFFGKKYGN